MGLYTIMKFDYEVIINKPVDEVFDFFVTNFATNYPKVSEQTLEVTQYPEEQVKEGTLFEVVNARSGEIVTHVYLENNKFKKVRGRFEPDLDGKKETLRYEVIEYEHNKRFVMQEATNPNIELFCFCFFSQETSKTLVKYEYRQEHKYKWTRILIIPFKSTYNNYNKPILKNLKQLLDRN